MDEVSADELKTRLESGDDVQVVDIREVHEPWNVDGFVPGAVHVPMSRLTSELGKHDWGDEIYVICRHGNSSVQAARLLEAYEGVPDDARVVSVERGYLDWEYEVVENAQRERTKATA